MRNSWAVENRAQHYPKYHYELNFIKQYWGAAKFHYRIASRVRTLEVMQKMMLESLDNIPLEQI